MCSLSHNETEFHIYSQRSWNNPTTKIRHCTGITGSTLNYLHPWKGTFREKFDLVICVLTFCLTVLGHFSVFFGFLCKILWIFLWILFDFFYLVICILTFCRVLGHFRPLWSCIHWCICTNNPSQSITNLFVYAQSLTWLNWTILT